MEAHEAALTSHQRPYIIWYQGTVILTQILASIGSCSYMFWLQHFPAPTSSLPLRDLRSLLPVWRRSYQIYSSTSLPSFAVHKVSVPRAPVPGFEDTGWSFPTWPVIPTVSALWVRHLTQRSQICQTNLGFTRGTQNNARVPAPS